MGRGLSKALGWSEETEADDKRAAIPKKFSARDGQFLQGSVSLRPQCLRSPLDRTNYSQVTAAAAKYGI
jgi:hypothetical protein